MFTINFEDFSWYFAILGGKRKKNSLPEVLKIGFYRVYFWFFLKTSLNILEEKNSFNQGNFCTPLWYSQAVRKPVLQGDATCDRDLQKLMIHRFKRISRDDICRRYVDVSR